ncbi:MAG: A/G-specific adenine glycosylase, partial [Proteobacteria bacterium]|nr:A/G-specific adenine glycosylase [Pseudomonadota bacterium]
MLDRQHRQEKPKPAADALLAWYDRARRDLPWRAAPDQHADPYRVWLSEIMLQQTTVAAVKPYFATFTSRWPTVEALAAAEPDAVLGAWAGLGYYARARNLIACAAKIAQEHGGRFPDTEADLLTLPGIGAYTAAAITAIAFGHRSVVVDGNVERVVARYCAITEPLPGAKGAIRTAADHLTPDLRPGDYAQAMMDLGATVCTPRAPACGRCPLSAGCAARKQGIAADLPRKAAKSGRPIRRGAAFVLRDGEGRLLVRRRPAKGLLGGMLEVPGTDWIADMPLPTGPIAAPLSAQWREAGSITHVFTHFTLELRVFAAKVPSGTIP